MISDIDIHDWDKVDFSPFAKNPAGQQKMVAYHEVLKFVEQVELIRTLQLQRWRAALLREKEE